MYVLVSTPTRSYTCHYHFLPTNNFLSLSPYRSSTSSKTSGSSSSSSKPPSKPKNWVVQRLSKILMREDTQGSKKGGLKDFLSSLWVSWKYTLSLCIHSQNKGLNPCCTLFTPKAKGELKPVWEGLQFAHQHSCCWAVCNGAPGILNETTGSTGQAILTISQGFCIFGWASHRRMLLLSNLAHASCNLLTWGC